MTAPKEGEPTAGPAWAPRDANRFPVEVLVVWSMDSDWRVDRVLYRVNKSAVNQHPAWPVPQTFAKAHDLDALWEYLPEKGGNFYNWELYDIEVARPDDIEALVADFEAYVESVGHPVGPPVGTIQLGIGTAAAMPFVILADDGGHPVLVATELLTGDARVTTESGTVSPCEFHSGQPVRDRSVGWPLMPAVDYCVRWADRMARLRIHEGATIDTLAIGEPGEQLPHLPPIGKLPEQPESGEPSSSRSALLDQLSAPHPSAAMIAAMDTV